MQSRAPKHCNVRFETADLVVGVAPIWFILRLMDMRRAP